MTDKRGELFGPEDIGCYGSGLLGHDHVRERMATLVKTHCANDPEAGDILRALREPMSDDAWEEDEALGLLDTRCTADVVFMLRDGDLMLESLEDEDDGD